MRKQVLPGIFACLALAMTAVFLSKTFHTGHQWVIPLESRQGQTPYALDQTEWNQTFVPSLGGTSQPPSPLQPFSRVTRTTGIPAVQWENGTKKVFSNTVSYVVEPPLSGPPHPSETRLVSAKNGYQITFTSGLTLRMIGHGFRGEDGVMHVFDPVSESTFDLDGAFGKRHADRLRKQDREGIFCFLTIHESHTVAEPSWANAALRSKLPGAGWGSFVTEEGQTIYLIRRLVPTPWQSPLLLRVTLSQEPWISENLLTAPDGITTNKQFGAKLLGAFPGEDMLRTEGLYPLNYLDPTKPHPTARGTSLAFQMTADRYLGTALQVITEPKHSGGSFTVLGNAQSFYFDDIPFRDLTSVRVKKLLPAPEVALIEFPPLTDWKPLLEPGANLADFPLVESTTFETYDQLGRFLKTSLALKLPCVGDEEPGEDFLESPLVFPAGTELGELLDAYLEYAIRLSSEDWILNRKTWEIEQRPRNKLLKMWDVAVGFTENLF